MLAQSGIKQTQPKLYKNGAHQHDHQGDREGDALGMKDLLERSLCQLKADHHHQGSHRKTGQILVAGVTVGMVFVGRLFRQLKADQSNDGAGRVGQIVHGVGSDGHRAGNGADDQLSRAQKGIAQNANNAGEAADLAADSAVFLIGIVFHKKS